MEIIEESGRFRVGIEHDESAESPYDDGASPVVSLRRGGCQAGAYCTRLHATQVNDGGWRCPSELLSAIEEAYNRDESGRLCDRYLRTCRGVTSVVNAESSDLYAFTFDPAEWRESVGAPEGSANADEWNAWMRGECYGYVIQERTTWRTDDGRNMDTWETVDSCWGFYGWDYAEQTARDTFRDVFAAL